MLVEDAYTGLVLWRHRGGPVRHLAWSADGRRLLIAGARHGAVYDLAGGRPRALRLAAGERLQAAAFAPAGARLALAVWSAGVTRVQLRGAKAALTEAPERLRSLTWSPDGRWLVAGWASGSAYLIGTREPDVRRLDDVPRRLGAGVRTLGWCCP